MKQAIQVGLITGLVSSLWTHIEYSFGITKDSFGGVAGFIPYIILFAGIGFGMFARRRSEEFGRGVLSFKEGARSGVIISLVAGLILAAYSMVYGLIINPGYLQQYVDFVRESLETTNKNAAEIERAIADIKKDGSVGQLMFSKFMITLVIGMVGTFIMAGLFKKESGAEEEVSP